MSGSFWDLSDGTAANESASASYSGNTGFEPIPNNTRVLAMPEDVEWKTYQGAEHVSIKWRVAKPSQYANRVLFQSLYVTDDKPQFPGGKGHDCVKVRDEARRTFATINLNTGSKLGAGKPTDIEMQKAFVNKPMVLLVGLFNEKNNIRGVHAKDTEIAADVAKKAKPAPIANPFDDEGDDIPY
jgi:hypothetical protein